MLVRRFLLERPKPKAQSPKPKAQSPKPKAQSPRPARLGGCYSSLTSRFPIRNPAATTDSSSPLTAMTDGAENCVMK